MQKNCSRIGKPKTQPFWPFLGDPQNLHEVLLSMYSVPSSEDSEPGHGEEGGGNPEPRMETQEHSENGHPQFPAGLSNESAGALNFPLLLLTTQSVMLIKMLLFLHWRVVRASSRAEPTGETPNPPGQPPPPPPPAHREEPPLEATEEVLSHPPIAPVPPGKYEANTQETVEVHIPT